MLEFFLDHQTAILAWTLVALGGVNGIAQYKFPKTPFARGASYVFHFALDVLSPTVRADSTGTASTLPIAALDTILSRENQGTFKVPLLQRSAPPRRLAPVPGRPPDGG